MSRITKMPVGCQWAAGLAVSLLLSGCACGAVTPVFGVPDLGPVPEGVTISRSGFDGGPFSAALPVRDEAGDPGSAEVLERLAPVLKALGFQRSLTELAGPARPLRREPPDLRSLAVEICREAAILESRGSREVCGALIDGRSSPVAEEAVRNAYGVSFGDWKADLERLSFEYPFAQVVAGVPIEGTGLFVLRRQGESPSLVYGSLFNRYLVVNRSDARLPDSLLKTSLLLLTRQLGDGPPLSAIGRPSLVLVPGGSARTAAGEEVPALRYAWRILVARQEGPESWMAWIDAASGELLRVADQGNDAGDAVPGVRWRRDPGLCAQTAPSCIESPTFEVDRRNGQLALQLNGVFLQVEPGSPEVAPGPSGFNLAPIRNSGTAVCAAQGNRAFRQVHVYSHLYSLWKMIASVGTVPKFPEKPLRIVVDDPDPGDQKGSAAYYDNSKTGDALSSLWLADGQGFREARCPAAPGYRMNGAQDVTVLAHEMAHLVVQRVQERRPSGWCNCATCTACPLPDVLGHNILHDFADGLAFSYASTSCFAGWSAKNLDGPDANLYCKGKTSEAGGFPRLASLPADRFPDHRLQDPQNQQGLQGEYANGQTAAAGLWEVRKGMRSKALVTGTQEHWVRLLRALGGFGFLSNACSKAVYDSQARRYRYTSCDRDVFLYLQDLERRMVVEWLAGGAAGRATVNKVLSGWARAGLFLVPFVCLDGDPATTDSAACPASKNETALDAVIEIDDQDKSDDLRVDGIVHPEVDYLRKDGPPRFEVWTGPRYRFSADRKTLSPNALPPCGNRFQVELAADPQFQQVVWKSPQVAAGPACSGDVALSPADWIAVQKSLAGPRVYYRARTWDASGRGRLSTSPGGGAFQIAPPFAVITADGKP